MKQEQTNQALAALVRRARDGDRAAAEALYQQSYPALYRTVRAACRDEATAADVLQESYIQALTHLDELRRPTRFLPWLKRIAVNELRQQLRRKQPTLFSELPAEGDSLPEPVEYDTPEARLEKKEDAEQIRELLNCLPDGQRTVLILYYCEQYSVKEIAEQLGVSQSTVKSQLHYGRKRLESELQKLEKRGVRLLGAATAPLLLRRMTAAQNVPPAGAYPACELAPPAASLTAKTGAVLLPRVLATAATLAVIGGAAVGVGLAVRAHTGKTAEETAPIYMDAERPKPVEQDEEPTEESTEESTEEPAENTTALTEALPASAADLPEPTETQQSEPETTENQTPAAVQPASSGDLTEQTEQTLPTENPYPFQFQELMLPVGTTWTGSFATDEEWLVTVFAHTPNLSETTNVFWPSFSGGVQTVTIELNTPGTYTYSLCRDNGQYAWIRWVRITVTPAEGAG